MKTEKDVERALVVSFEKKGWLCKHIDMPGTIGWPDLFVARDGRFAFIECKINTIQLRQTQTAYAAVLALKYSIENIFVVSYINKVFKWRHIVSPKFGWEEKNTADELTKAIILELI